MALPIWVNKIEECGYPFKSGYLEVECNQEP